MGMETKHQIIDVVQVENRPGLVSPVSKQPHTFLGSGGRCRGIEEIPGEKKDQVRSRNFKIDGKNQANGDGIRGQNRVSIGWAFLTL